MNEYKELEEHIQEEEEGIELWARKMKEANIRS